MKTFGKKGDKGETSLLFGQRVSKCDPRCEAYGTIDEAVSSLGMARNLVKKDKTRDAILKVQKALFMVSAELATKCEDYEKFISRFQPVTTAMANDLERLIVEIEGEVEMPEAFIVPGASLASASLDMARTILRRAERRACALKDMGELRNEAILQYLNRAADLLFTLARYEEAG
ncbi:MAG: cob(I)yrinic acid a,c-diamide adenosyltransferase [Chloroflexi bacterium]|nr:cob(I)yrinic acid a,c-diamide adenosyltransferase [Chloroflexota bacterium]